MIALFYVIPALTFASTLTKAALILLALGAPIIVLEYYFRPSFLISIRPRTAMCPVRIGIKLFGLYAIWFGMGLIYWLFPEYQKPFYQPFLDVIGWLFPALFGLAVPYFIWVDRRMEQPEDGYYHLGLWLLGRQPSFENSIKPLLMGWLVKAFFLPLMWVYLNQNIASADVLQWQIRSFFSGQGFKYLYDFLWRLFFFIDLAFACAGYLLTLRLLDTHIRSTDPTILGWLSALVCYQPFVDGLFASYLAYNLDQFYWGDWLAEYPVIYMIWGSIILFCLCIYALSTVMFGLRFSNLTHRGIITNGPYRYSKHPAYCAKNISWWLITIPFIHPEGKIGEIIRACLMLILVNAIYYIRAKTEERHLMCDPVYRLYADWINQYGLIARIRRLFHSTQ